MGIQKKKSKWASVTEDETVKELEPSSQGVRNRAKWGEAETTEKQTPSDLIGNLKSEYDAPTVDSLQEEINSADAIKAAEDEKIQEWRANELESNPLTNENVLDKMIEDPEYRVNILKEINAPNEDKQLSASKTETSHSLVEIGGDPNFVYNLTREERLNRLDRYLPEQGRIEGWSFLDSDKSELRDEQYFWSDRTDREKVAIDYPLHPDVGIAARLSENSTSFTDFFSDRYSDLKRIGEGVAKRESDLALKVKEYNEAPTPENKIYIEEEYKRVLEDKTLYLHSLSEVKQMKFDYKVAYTKYLKNEEKKGSTVGSIAKQLAGGLMERSTDLGITGMHLIGDMPFIGTPEVYNVTEKEIKEAEEKGVDVLRLMGNKATRHLINDVMPKVKDQWSFGTTDEWEASEDRNDLQRVMQFVSRSVGTGMGGGKYATLGFMAQAHKGLQEEMAGEEFDGMSFFDKQLISVPYALAIGQLEKIGFVASTGGGKMVNDIVRKATARTFTNLPKNASKSMINRKMSESIMAMSAEGIFKIGAGGIIESVTEGSQSALDVTWKTVVNSMVDHDFFDVPDLSTEEGRHEAWGMIKEEAYYGMLSGFLMGGPSISYKIMKDGFHEKAGDKEFENFKGIIMNEELRSLSIDNLKEQIANGEITKEEAEKQLDSMDRAVAIINSMPEDMSTRDQKNSFELIKEKQQLEKKVVGKDKSLTKKEHDRIKEINEDLESISTGKTDQATDQAKGSKLFSDPNPETKTIADKYKKDKGIETVEGESFKEIDTEKSKKISDAYAAMEDNPNDPEVKAAYEAMATETVEQHKAIDEAGYTFEIWEGEGEPYANSSEMIADVRDNKHMYIFSTEKGYGDAGITDQQREDNPLLKDSGVKDVNGTPLLINDVFRGVHDFFGHTERGNSFGAKGEENAWDVHARMYSDKARRAMTTETRGQNSFVNFSGVNDAVNAKFKKANQLDKDGKTEEASALRKEAQGEMQFAEQKIGLMPEEFSNIEEKYNKKKESKLTEEHTSKLTLTEDGDIVAHNFGFESKDNLAPGLTTGKGLQTSKEERDSINSVGGMTMFYTQEGQQETGVGDVQSTVKFKPEEVYPIKEDPDGLYDEAKRQFKEKMGNQAFNPNMQTAWITKVAIEKGYKATISEWNGGYRMQTTAEIKTEKENTPFKKQDKAAPLAVGDNINIYGEDATVTGVDGDIVEYKGEKSSGSFNPNNLRKGQLKPAKESKKKEEVVAETTEAEKSNVSRIQQIADKASKAIKKVLPDTKIVVHENEQSYKKATGEEGRQQSSNGEYNPKTNTVHINGVNANERTVAHEVFHAVLLSKVKDDKRAAKVTKEMVEEVSSKIDEDSDLKEYLDDFISNYDENIQNEEKIAELVGSLSEHWQDASPSVKSTIKKWVDKIAKIFGLDPFSRNETYEMLNTMARKVAKGKVISEGDISSFKGGTEVESPVDALNRKQVGAFDVQYTEQKKKDQLMKDGLLTEPDNLSEFSDMNTAITSPDDMLAGTISIDGKTIFEGGGGVFFVTKYGDVWASGNETTANKLRDSINSSLNKNGGKGLLVLAKGTDSKLISSVSGVNSSLAVLDVMMDKGLISASDFRSAVAGSVKTAGGLIKLGGSAKQLRAEVDRYFSDPTTTTFQKRGDVVKDIIGRLSQSESIKKNNSEIVELLGGDNNKRVGKSAGIKSQGLSDLVAGVASEQLTKGLHTGDVYAVIEVNSEVEVVKDSHPSYPYHIRIKEGSKPVLHLPKVRQNGSEVLTTSTNKKYRPTIVSVMAGTFNSESSFESPAKRKQEPGKPKKTKRQKEEDLKAGVTKKRTKVTINEEAALKDQIKFEARAAKAGSKFEKDNRKAVYDYLKIKFKGFKGEVGGRRVGAILNKALTMDLSNPVIAKRFTEYVEKTIKDANHDTKITESVRKINRIKELAKSKDLQGGLSLMAKRFADIDPMVVEDIDLFMSQADEVINMISRSKAGVRGTKDNRAVNILFRQPANKADMDGYIEDQLELTENFRKDVLLSHNPELEDAGIISKGMTLSEMKAAINEWKDKEAATSEEIELEKEVIEAIKEEFKNAQENLKTVLWTGLNPATGEELTPLQIEAIEYLSLSTQLISNIKNRKEILIIRDIITSFNVNGVDNMLASKARYIKGRQGAKDMAAETKTKPIDTSGVSGWVGKKHKAYNGLFAQVDEYLRRIFKSTETMLKFKERSGFGDLENGASKAKRVSLDKKKAYHNKWRKKKPNKLHFYDKYNVYQRSTYSWLVRNSGGPQSEIDSDFKRRLGLVVDTHQYLTSQGHYEGEVRTESEIMEGELLESVLKDLGILANPDISLSDIGAKVDRVNKLAVNDMISLWADSYNDISDAMSLLYNTEFDRDVNYTHDSWVKKGHIDNSVDQLQETLDGGAMSGLQDGHLSSHQSGALMGATKPSNVKGNRRLSFDFEKAQFQAYESAMIDIHTAGPVYQMKGFFESAEANNIASPKDLQNIKKKLFSVVQRERGHALGETYRNDLWKSFNKIFNAAGTYVTSLVLGGPKGLVLQTVPAYLATVVNAGPAALGMASSYIRRAGKLKKWVSNEGIDLSLRGVKSQAEIDIKDVDMTNNSTLRALATTPKKVFNFWVEKFLVVGDKGITMAMFQTYYKKGLMNQGMTLFEAEKALKDDIKNNRMNPKAREFAKSQVNRFGNASNENLMGDFFTSKEEGTRAIRKTAFVYATFMMNQKTRIFNDMNIIRSKGVSGKERRAAGAGVGATLVELTAYHALRTAYPIGITMLTVGLSGWDDDEYDTPAVRRKVEKENKDRKINGTTPEGRAPLAGEELSEFQAKTWATLEWQKGWKGAGSSIAADFLSPVPLSDNSIKGIINEYALTPLQRAYYDKEIEEAIDNENKKIYLESGGVKDKMSEEATEEFIRKYEEEEFFGLYDYQSADRGSFGVMSIGIETISELGKYYNAAAHGEVAVGSGNYKTTKYLKKEDQEIAADINYWKVLTTALGVPPDIGGYTHRKGWKILEKSAFSESQFTKYNELNSFLDKNNFDAITDEEEKMIKSGRSVLTILKETRPSMEEWTEWKIKEMEKKIEALTNDSDVLDYKINKKTDKIK